MSDTTLIKKHLIRPFLNNGTSAVPSWVQIKKATEFVRAMNPQTEERDYISDEHPTTEVMDYKPSENLAVTMYKGEPDFEMFYDLYKKRAIGSDAQKEFLLVNIFDSVTAGSGSEAVTYYYAEKTNASITVEELNTTGKTLSINVYENGTPAKGYVTITNGVPTFTEGDMPSS